MRLLPPELREGASGRGVEEWLGRIKPIATELKLPSATALVVDDYYGEVAVQVHKELQAAWGATPEGCDGNAGPWTRGQYAERYGVNPDDWTASNYPGKTYWVDASGQRVGLWDGAMPDGSADPRDALGETDDDASGAPTLSDIPRCPPPTPSPEDDGHRHCSTSLEERRAKARPTATPQDADPSANGGDVAPATSGATNCGGL